MKLIDATRRSATARTAAAGAQAKGQRLAGAVRANAAGANGPAATLLADVDAYHQAWISAVNPEEAAAAAAAAAANKTAGAAAAAPAAAAIRPGYEKFEAASRDAYYTRRHELVLRHFPTALGVDDFISRVEVALSAHGFRGDNSIAMTNLCRDEITTVLKDKIEGVFGGSFNTNGLGAVLTCGVTGIKAGLSHSPLSVEDGRERYVFFSFPHTAINDAGELGAVARPNRPGTSCACGALAKALKELQTEGLAPNCRVPGVHDPLDPEYSILKQRLARRIRYERLEPVLMDLSDMTAVAERVITDDLEYLIEKCVDVEKADYAVVTGVQIHNWSGDLSADNFEFVAPTKVYVVNRGQITVLDLMQLPALTPRQIQALGREAGLGAAPSGVSNADVPTALQSLPADYLARRICSSPPTPAAENFVLDHVPIPDGPKPIPMLPEAAAEPLEIKESDGTVRRLGRPTMDGEDEERHTSFRVPPGVKVE